MEGVTIDGVVQAMNTLSREVADGLIVCCSLLVDGRPRGGVSRQQAFELLDPPLKEVGAHIVYVAKDLARQHIEFESKCDRIHFDPRFEPQLVPTPEPVVQICTLLIEGKCLESNESKPIVTRRFPPGTRFGVKDAAHEYGEPYDAQAKHEPELALTIPRTV